jgi:hypothetical protein
MVFVCLCCYRVRNGPRRKRLNNTARGMAVVRNVLGDIDLSCFKLKERRRGGGDGRRRGRMIGQTKKGLERGRIEKRKENIGTFT